MFFRIVKWNGNYQIDVLAPNGKWFIGTAHFVHERTAADAARDFFGMTEWIKPTPTLAEIPGYIES